MLNIALPKGRLGEKVYKILAESGYACPEIEEDNRKLVFINEESGVSYFWVKPSDVPIYVELGAADIGVVGKDILLENESDVYELLDLNMGKCRMCVASKEGYIEDTSKPLRVATKFVNIAKTYYNEKNREIEVIKLNGSIELAPLLNMADVIVDIVESGKTLKENNLKVYEEILPISTRLIAGKSSYKFKRKEIDTLKNTLAKVRNND